MRTPTIARIPLMLGFLLFSPFGAADFDTAMDAYERQDYATAVREFQASASEGDAGAQYMLGRIYERGMGVAQDFVQAHKWYNLAASQGNFNAARAREALAGRMTPSQIAEAQRLARNWQPGAKPIREEPSTEPTRDWQSGAKPSPQESPAEPTRDTVAAIQRSLNELGYNAGPVDGLMGSKTRAAIRGYQADQGLALTGQPSRELLDHLQGVRQPPAQVVQPPAQAAQPPAPAEPRRDDRPRQRVLLQDAFQDGNYTANPAWQVVAGEFWVERAIGLRSVHEIQQPASEAPQELSPRDLAGAIVGAILEEAIGPRDQQARPRTEPVDYAEIYAPQYITNAFAVESILSAYRAQGQLIFGPYQSQDRADGYRLVFSPSQAPRFSLLRVSRAGYSVIDSSNRDLGLDLGQPYRVRWTRDTQGEMAVFIEDQELFRVIDRSFRDPFNGFTLINQGGDYALRAITIYGME